MTTPQYIHAILTLISGAIFLVSTGLIVASFWSDKPILWKLGFSGFVVAYFAAHILNLVRP